MQALFAGGPNANQSESGWRRHKSGAPYYDFWSGSGGRIRVWIEAPDHDTAWRDVASYGALTADVAVTLLACLASDSLRASTCAPRRESVWLGGSAVLYAKNYKRFGAERLEFVQVIDAAIERVLNLRFDILNYPGFDPVSRTWKRDGVTRYGVALFEIDQDHTPAANDNCTGAAPLRFGVWADHWLHAAGPMWVSPMPEELIRLDHRNSRGADVLAKKFGILMSLSWGATRDEKRQVHDVRSLLRRIGELRRPGAHDAHYGGRLADRFEEALLRLQETSVFEASIRSETAQAARREGRRWFDDWLDAKVSVARPTFITARPAP